MNDSSYCVSEASLPNICPVPQLEMAEGSFIITKETKMSSPRRFSHSSPSHKNHQSSNAVASTRRKVQHNSKLNLSSHMRRIFNTSSSSLSSQSLSAQKPPPPLSSAALLKETASVKTTAPAKATAPVKATTPAKATEPITATAQVKATTPAKATAPVKATAPLATKQFTKSSSFAASSSSASSDRPSFAARLKQKWFALVGTTVQGEPVHDGPFKKPMLPPLHLQR